MRDFALHVVRDFAVGAADQHIGLHADLAELADRVLRGLALQFAGGSDVGDEGDVDVAGVGAAEVGAHLADGLEEGQALDVADRTANLCDEDVVAFGGIDDARFDLVCDVGDDLDGGAQVFTAPLLGDDGVVDAARREVVEPGHAGGAEALVVAEVEIGLCAVVGDEDLAVLQRVHRTGVDIHIGVEFEETDLEATGLHDGAERGGDDAFAERGDDAARDKNKLLRIAMRFHGTCRC